ncbi:MAG: aminoglycoside 6'-N-acetyltransferase [Cyclobacteriaceae bacterium]
MDIRIATENDQPELIKMGKQLWPETSKSELEKSFSTTFTSSSEVTFIGELDDVPIGFTICSLRSDYVEGSRKSPTGYLEAIFMAPEFRNKGWASALVAQGEHWCQQRGCTQMGSDTETTNIVSQQFHEKLGFKETNRIVCFIKPIEL